MVTSDAIIPDAEIHIVYKVRVSKSIKKKLNHRNAIELAMGIMKTDNGLDGNYLNGATRARINATISGFGFNIRINL